MSSPPIPTSQLVRYSLIPIGIVLACLFVWKTAQVLLMVFAGMLLAMLLNALAGPVERRLHTSHGWALSGVILMAALLAAGFFSFALPQLSEQADRLGQRIPQSVAQAEAMLQDMGIPERILEEARTQSSAAAAAVSAMSAFFALFFTVITGIYLAANPGPYRRMLLAAVPHRLSKRTGEMLDDAANTLQRWIIARLILMLINGTAVTIGLLILGVPLAPFLGVVAGLLNFVPNLGPIIAAVPAILMGLSLDVRTGVYVGLLYLVLQAIDGYVLTPLADKEAVSLPPALTLVFQVMMGLLLGAGGVLLATPILTLGYVVVRHVPQRDDEHRIAA